MRAPVAAIAVLLALLAGAGCGPGSSDSSTTTATAQPATTTGSTGGAAGGGPQSPGSLDAAALTKSVERQMPVFLSRSDTTLVNSLQPVVGEGSDLKLVPNSVACLPGSQTPAIRDPQKYPFACIATVAASGGGLTIEVKLGLVVFSVRGVCWRASNERILATGTRPVLIPRTQALNPENVISGCAG